MREVLSAICYCHEHNIVHKDLKPENLLLESKQSNSCIKVIDFGTSSLFEKKNENKMKSKEGTPYYIAPEVLGLKYDEKCDLWSCGVILYIMLSGYPPFNGETPKQIMDKVRLGKYEMTSDVWHHISPQAKSLVDALLTYDPLERISAKQAILHPWIQTHTQTQEIAEYQDEILNSLSRFFQY